MGVVLNSTNLVTNELIETLGENAEDRLGGTQSDLSRQPIIQDTFVRIEDKFFMPKGMAKCLKALVQEHCQPAYLETGTNYTLVESIYFDSEGLDLYQHHFSKLDTRFKLRVRRYAPNGDWQEGAAFLEAKSKVRTETGSISSKKRFRIDPTNLDILIHSEDMILTEDLLKLNPAMNRSELLTRVNFVNDLVRTYHLWPQLRVRYQRLAFEGEGVRVTFDKNIKFKSLHKLSRETSHNIKHLELWASASGMKEVFSNDDYFVCEVKYGQAMPSWLEQYFASHSIQKVSFSKYCWGLTNLLDRQEDTLR